MNREIFFAAIRPDLFGGRLTQSQVEGIITILDEWDRRRLTTLQHLAYMLATVKHETAHTMQPIMERGPKKYFDRYEGRKDLGNTIKGDGYRFRGRGFVQITGRANYNRAAKELGVDLVASPERALDPTLAAAILFTGMQEGWFTGKKLSDYFDSGMTNWREARRIINALDKADLIAGYGKRFFANLQFASVVDLPSSSPSTPPVSLPQPPRYAWLTDLLRSLFKWKGNKP